MAATNYSQKNTGILTVYSKKKIRNIYLNYLDFYKIISLLSIGLGLINPFFLVTGFILLGIVFYKKIYLEVFSSNKKKNIYKKILWPQNRQHFTTFGYEVAPEDIEEHINRISDFNSKDLAMQERIEKRKKYNLIGFSKDTITTHAIFLGKTGAGKTATSFTFIEDCMRQGGGITFIDGKADMKMFQQFFAIAAKYGREPDVRLINLNAPELKPDTNSFNPTAVMNEDVTVEFFGSLVDKGSSEGNAQYFLNRGKAVLKTGLAFSNLRRDYYDENFSIETIRSNTSVSNINIIYMTLYCKLMELEEYLNSNKDIQVFINAARNIKTLDFPKAATVESLVAYFIQNPTEKYDFEKRLNGLDYNFIYRLYIKAFSAVRFYVDEIYNQWGSMLESASELMYEYVKQQERSFLPTSSNPLAMSEIRELKSFIEENAIMLASQFSSKINGAKVNQAFGQKGIDALPEDAVQQHSYAQQQWTDLFTLFTMYDHVFGDPDPDIDGEDMLKNNKLTYILLPVLKLSADTASTLGKIFITSKTQIAAKALGDRVEYTPTQQNIIKDRITPKPLFLIEADEYGAYPVPRIDLASAQLRSINIGLLVSVQDYTSLRVGGTDENSAKRVWANAAKIALNIVDEEALQKLREAIVELDYLTAKKTDTMDGDHVESLDLDSAKNIAFDPKMLQAFSKGAGIIFQKEVPIIFQSFYSDPKPASIFLTRYKRYKL